MQSHLETASIHPSRIPNRFVWLMVLGLVGCSPDGSPPPAPTPVVDLVAVKKKAEAGDAAAEALLGKCYAEGQGTPADYPLAVKWYRAAVSQGNAEAEAGRVVDAKEDKRLMAKKASAVETGANSPS